MGHSTSYKGVFPFETYLTAEQIDHLEDILGEDVRDHPEWETLASFKLMNENYVNYIDLELDGFGGDKLKWNGSEKTNGLELQVNLVVELMQLAFPGVRLRPGAVIKARGEDGKRYNIEVNSDGLAVVVQPVKTAEKSITCPHYGERI